MERNHDAMQNFFKKHENLTFSIKPWTPTGLKIPNPDDVKILCTSERDDESRQCQETIASYLKNQNYVDAVNQSPEEWKTETLRLKVSGEALDQLKIPFSIQNNIEDLLSPVIYGSDRRFVLETFIEQKQTSVYISATDMLKKPGDLGNLLFPVGNGLLPLRSFISTSQSSEWSRSDRLNLKERYEVSANFKANVKGTTLNEALTNLKHNLSMLKNLPSGSFLVLEQGWDAGPMRRFVAFTMRQQIMPT